MPNVFHCTGENTFVGLADFYWQLCLKFYLLFCFEPIRCGERRMWLRNDDAVGGIMAVVCVIDCSFVLQLRS